MFTSSKHIAIEAIERHSRPRFIYRARLWQSGSGQALVEYSPSYVCNDWVIGKSVQIPSTDTLSWKTWPKVLTQCETKSLQIGPTKKQIGTCNKLKRENQRTYILWVIDLSSYIRDGLQENNAKRNWAEELDNCLNLGLARLANFKAACSGRDWTAGKNKDNLLRRKSHITQHHKEW